MNAKRTRAVVLLSGGLDSVTALAVALDRGHEVFPLIFDYGQRHRREIECAKAVVLHYMGQRTRGIMRRERVVKVEGLVKTKSALMNKSLRLEKTTECKGRAPNTYVPARNILFLAAAASVAESIGAGFIYTGFVDARCDTGHADSWIGFTAAMQAVLCVGTACGLRGCPVELVSPLAGMGKADVIEVALRLGAPLHLSWSCFEDSERPCGVCETCELRARAFEAVGVPDPALGVDQAGNGS